MTLKLTFNVIMICNYKISNRFAIHPILMLFLFKNVLISSLHFPMK